MGGGPMAALRLFLGWVFVVGCAVYVIRNPDEVMAAVDYILEAIARWIDLQVNSA